DICEHGAGHEFFLARIDVAGDIDREQIGRALDALELAGDRARQRPREHRLSDARTIFQQYVAAREERRDHKSDDVALADPDALDVRDEALDVGMRGGERAVAIHAQSPCGSRGTASAVGWLLRTSG